MGDLSINDSVEDSEVKNGELNKKFLEEIDENSRKEILQSIATHYGVTSDVIADEVVDEKAEFLLDYMVEPARTGAFALMIKHGYIVVADQNG